jgi:hypothetical protein
MRLLSNIVLYYIVGGSKRPRCNKATTLTVRCCCCHTPFTFMELLLLLCQHTSASAGLLLLLMMTTILAQAAPAAAAAAAAGAAASSLAADGGGGTFVVVTSAPHSTSPVLTALQQLPPLPVPHYAWPFCHLENSCTAEYMKSALPWSDAAVMREYARITHSVSAYAGLHLYSNLTEYEIDRMWQLLAAGVVGTGATIALQLEIAAAGTTLGMLSSPVRPSDTMRQQLRNATAALERANARLGTNASIGTVMVDQEGWGSSTPDQVTKNNDAVYHACVAEFGKDINIQYYGRGMASANDAQPGGFWQPAWYTMEELDNRQLSTSLYTVPEVEKMRMDYKTTVEKMANTSATCAAKNAKRGTNRWCPSEVVPWISLGAGYHPPTPNDSLVKAGRYHYQIPWDYPICTCACVLSYNTMLRGLIWFAYVCI